MCAGRKFQVQGADTEKAREEKLLVIPRDLVRILFWKNARICTEHSEKLVQRVERLRGMKCFPGSETVCR